MTFVAGRKPQAEQDHDPQWFILDRGRVLVLRDAGAVAFPSGSDLASMGFAPPPGFCLGTQEERPCLLGHGDASAAAPPGLEWAEVRSLSGAVDEERFWIAGRANHLAEWDRTHRRCGACGAELALLEEEWAKACPACSQVYYPQISPAVIVSVLDGDRILLARNRHYRYPFFSVLAGFVEAGENLEAAVHREIREEAGIAVKNLRYFGSQPWPFPNSLMVGFVADYAGGELTPDPSELLEARWFARDAMPEIPSSISIARRLIDAFVNRA
jgi:NAD+ diphosphatase